MQLRKRSSANIETYNEEIISSNKKQKIIKSSQKLKIKKEKFTEPKVEITIKSEDGSYESDLKLKIFKSENGNASEIKKSSVKQSKKQQKLGKQNGKEVEKSSRKLNRNKGKEEEPKISVKLEEELKLKIENIEDEKPPKRKRSTEKSSKKHTDTPVLQPLKYESLGCGPPALPYTGKKYVGCHVSGAGGVWNCFANGEMSNASSLALFLRNQRSWNAKPLDDNTVKKWNETIKDFPLHLILPHGSYLMNLGSPKADVLAKSRQLFIEELQRCEKLGILHFNFHPGSTLGEISREDCCKLISESINIGHKATSSVICVIENMSRQGFTVGGDFHEIRLMIEGVEDKSRVGVCIDTCHAHAAGYDLASEKGFDELVSDFEKIIGWQFLRALHVNDSKGKVGDHKDRHEVIGKGYIGREGFKRIMNCSQFNDMPLILETPFVSEDHYAKEIKLLQSMVK